MRLFAAVELSEKNISALESAARALKRAAEKGSFTRRENFHITLCFIGETKRMREAKEAVTALKAEPFDIRISGAGVFRRAEGDIVWAGLEKSKELEAAAEFIAEQLRKKGFEIEKRGFTAHITLARRFIPAPGFDIKAFSESFKPLTQRVDKISLMSSALVDGRRKYEAIYINKLG